MGEVFNGDPNIICPYLDDLDGVLNFPKLVHLLLSNNEQRLILTAILRSRKLSHPLLAI